MSALDLFAEEFLSALTRTLRERPALRTELSAMLAPTPEVAAPDNVYLTVGEYAARLRLSKRTIENLIREGLPIAGRGRRRRVHVANADTWMQGERGTQAIEARARADVRRAARSRSGASDARAAPSDLPLDDGGSDGHGAGR